MDSADAVHEHLVRMVTERSVDSPAWSEYSMVFLSNQVQAIIRRGITEAKQAKVQARDSKRAAAVAESLRECGTLGKQAGLLLNVLRAVGGRLPTTHQAEPGGAVATRSPEAFDDLSADRHAYEVKGSIDERKGDRVAGLREGGVYREAELVGAAHITLSIGSLSGAWTATLPRVTHIAEVKRAIGKSRDIPPGTITLFGAGIEGALPGDLQIGRLDHTGISDAAILSMVIRPWDNKTAVKALYASLGGAQWTQKQNWMTKQNPEEWYGLTVDKAGTVTKLMLGDNGLTGAVPQDLDQLVAVQDLETLGKIPTEIQLLTNLVHCDLHGNEIVGCIPAELCSLSKLATIDLSSNQMSGCIPRELGKLRGLKVLNLDCNSLTGPIPRELGNCTALETLSLHRNMLSGLVSPDLFPREMTALTELYLSANRFAGTLPEEVANLTGAVEIYFNGNLLHGKIPSGFGQLPRLVGLNLSNNRFHGVDQFGTLMGRLNKDCFVSL